MGKRLTVLLLTAISTSVFAAGIQPLFNYKELGWDTPRTSAETAFTVRFSDSRVFHCYRNGKLSFKLSVGSPAKGLRSGQAAEAQYRQKHGAPFEWSDSASYIELEEWLEKSNGSELKYIGIGKPLFDANDNLKYMVVELLNGRKVEFTRFGPIPEFPFDTPRKLKPFFYYQVNGEPQYLCGPISQPD